MASRSRDACQYVGPCGPQGQRGETGPRGDPGIRHPVAVSKSGGRGLVTIDGEEFQLVEWESVVVQLLHKLGLRPGDRLIVKRCDGSTEELPLDALNAECASGVHDT